jgi:hypothetical protein
MIDKSITGKAIFICSRYVIRKPFLLVTPATIMFEDAPMMVPFPPSTPLSAKAHHNGTREML